jgi:hypothetical protein
MCRLTSSSNKLFINIKVGTYVIVSINLGSREDMLNCFKLVTCAQWTFYESFTIHMIIELSAIPVNNKGNDMRPISVSSIDYKYIQIIKT